MSLRSHLKLYGKNRGSDRALPKRRYDISPCILVYPSMLSPEDRMDAGVGAGASLNRNLEAGVLPGAWMIFPNQFASYFSISSSNSGNNLCTQVNQSCSFSAGFPWTGHRSSNLSFPVGINTGLSVAGPLGLARIRRRSKVSFYGEIQDPGLACRWMARLIGLAGEDHLYQLKSASHNDVPQSTDHYMEPAQHGVQDVLNISTEVHVFHRTRLDLDHARLEKDHARHEKDHARFDLDHARLDRLQQGISLGSRAVGEIPSSSKFGIRLLFALFLRFLYFVVDISCSDCLACGIDAGVGAGASLYRNLEAGVLPGAWMIFPNQFAPYFPISSSNLGNNLCTQVNRSCSFSAGFPWTGHRSSNLSFPGARGLKYFFLVGAKPDGETLDASVGINTSLSVAGPLGLARIRCRSKVFFSGEIQDPGLACRWMARLIGLAGEDHLYQLKSVVGDLQSRSEVVILDLEFALQ
ncbi:hypothetical protein F2Q69_00059708 [Brassica cretica]|uniref:Uncharacterized protein n=1 Tax=Brassica cretica TaxID=69181 RepID=A0A8S9RDX6_BRACR|nr:hypothetical protein F2Q69_00059708 [Brassica cretica]